jgi:peptide/nickel transport system ATP-binding protein
MPSLNATAARLAEIPGMVPAARDLGRTGCGFAPRCAHATARCRMETPALDAYGEGHVAACFAIEAVPA